MTINEILFLCVIFFSYTIESITGFAGTMLSMPAAMQLLGVAEAKTLINIIALTVAICLSIKNRKDINIKEAIKITVLMILGIIIGLYLFDIIPTQNLMTFYGIFIIVIAIRGLLVKKERKLPHGVLIGIVLCAGIIHGMFLSGGALLVFYVITKLKEKSVIRATLAPVWAALDSIILTQDIARGNINEGIISLSLFAIPIIIICILLGSYLHNKIQQHIFTKLTYVLIIISGVVALL